MGWTHTKKNNMKITEEKARKLTICPACGNNKDIGLIICWNCFKKPNGLKYSTLSFQEWIDKYGITTKTKKTTTKMKTKLMVAVEYYSEYPNKEFETFEIFETMEKAYKFSKNLKQGQLKETFIADFNTNEIYLEKRKEFNYNYNDTKHLYGYKVYIKLF